MMVLLRAKGKPCWCKCFEGLVLAYYQALDFQGLAGLSRRYGSSSSMCSGLSRAWHTRDAATAWCAVVEAQRAGQAGRSACQEPCCKRAICRLSPSLRFTRPARWARGSQLKQVSHSPDVQNLGVSWVRLAGWVSAVNAPLMEGHFCFGDLARL
jgi:hypothetical protein